MPSTEDSILYIRLDNTKNFTSIIKALQFRDLATFYGSKNGLKVTVEDCKCIQANAFFQESLFHEYQINQEFVVFMVNINLLLECLTIFGNSSNPLSNTSMIFSFGGEGCPLEILLEESGVVTECKLKTMEAIDSLDFDFVNCDIETKIIMKSECLKDVFAELDQSSEVLELTSTPNNLRLSTFGLAGSIHYDFPKDSEMIEAYNTVDAIRRYRYRLALLRPILRTLVLSSRVSWRTDDRGFLSLQFMIPTDDGQLAFVEFYCVPDETEEEEEDDDDDNDDRIL